MDSQPFTQLEQDPNQQDYEDNHSSESYGEEEESGEYETQNVQAESLSSQSALVAGVINLSPQQMKELVSALVMQLLQQEQPHSSKNRNREQNQATFKLCESVAESMIQFLDARVSQNSISVEELSRVLAIDDPLARKEYFRQEYSELHQTPETVREVLKSKPVKEVEYEAKLSRLSEFPQKRKTTDFKLKITSKSVISQMNLDECNSAHQCAIYESYQYLLSYLSGLLSSLLPLVKDATRFQLAASGKYSHLEDPMNDGLKRDPIFRNMSIGAALQVGSLSRSTFSDIEINLHKKIAHQFRQDAEDKFVKLFKTSELNSQLEQQEYCIAIQKQFDQLQSNFQEARQNEEGKEAEFQGSQSQENQSHLSQSYLSGLGLLSNHIDYSSLAEEGLSAALTAVDQCVQVEEITAVPADPRSASSKSGLNQNQAAAGVQDYDQQKRELLRKLKIRRDYLRSELYQVKP